MNDPTYDKEAIKARLEWDLAWVLSQIIDDNAPIGWSKHIFTAKCLLAHYDIKRKPQA